MQNKILYIGALGMLAAIMMVIAACFALWRMNAGLPWYEHLASYRPPVMSRVYAADGQLLAQYASEKRIGTPYEYIPPRLVQAFLAAEDKDFFNHYGIDGLAIVRSAMISALNLVRGRRLVGGSTITQQVARNFFLTREVRLVRKVREILLALRLERTLPKEQILELYLNEIYLGRGTYGITYAALYYFDKRLEELSLAEMAYLAALPKAPSNYHPVRQKARAVARRNWVLGRMAEDGYITPEQARSAQEQDLITAPYSPPGRASAQYFTAEVRRRVLDIYNEQTLYKEGLAIRTTLDPRLQDIAREAVRWGTGDYDRRHGYRGPIRRLPAGAYWPAVLKNTKVPAGLEPLRLAVVLELEQEGVYIGLKPAAAKEKSVKASENIFEAETGYIPFAEMKWAREPRADGTLGVKLKHPRDALQEGDIIYVEPIKLKKGEEIGYQAYALRQIPKINAALVAMNPHTGRVLAVTGGHSFSVSQFNRATQAWRQPGSAFKPFVYAAALDRGYTPASQLLDIPFAKRRLEGAGFWRPENYTEDFYEQSTLRVGLEKSRNLTTVHLAQTIGILPVMEYAKRLGIASQVRPELTLVLGAEETTLLRLTSAYAVLVNGGRRAEPFLIEKIQNASGRTIYRHDQRACWQCTAIEWQEQPVPDIPDTREQIMNPQTAYQLVSILEGAVLRGTGRRARIRGRPVAGKTGTTDEHRDAWFVGFSPDMVVGVFAGFDLPETLGTDETGGRVSAPIFSRFMNKALGDQPAIPFRIPPGITLVRTDATSGELVSGDSANAIWEAFKAGTEPRAGESSNGGVVSPALTPASASYNAQPAKTTRGGVTGTGGLY